MTSTKTNATPAKVNVFRNSLAVGPVSRCSVSVCINLLSPGSELDQLGDRRLRLGGAGRHAKERRVDRPLLDLGGLPVRARVGRHSSRRPTGPRDNMGRILAAL